MNREFVIASGIVGLGTGAPGYFTAWPLWLTAMMAVYFATGGRLLVWIMEPVFARWAAQVAEHEETEEAP